MMLGKLPLAIPMAIFAAGCMGIDAGWPSDTDPGCTEIGCNDRLEITIERQDGGSFETGEYEFVFSPSSGSPANLNCTLGVSSNLGCTGDIESLEFSIQNSAHQFLAVFDYAPPSINVEVAFDGESIGLEKLTPSYTIFTPNGPECEPTCLQSAVVVKLTEVQ